ncbi:hypothetical protein D9M68_466140 [compost metagenome]
MYSTPARFRVTPGSRLRPLVVAVACAMAGGATAMEIPTENPDLSIRWDNTLRYNLGMRAENPDSVGNNPAFDEGEYRFADAGDIVTNRLDLLSEFDLIYKRYHGFRVSAAAWYDHAYRDGEAHRNPDLESCEAAVGPGSYVNDKYSSYTKRFYEGPSGEILDAFVFSRFDLGEVPVSFKLGRHTVYWGESLLTSGNINGVSYAQAPLDLAKGTATPGTEVKELFRPLAQLSMNAQVTDDLTLAAQYFFEWESFRFTEGGTYLGPSDAVFNGPDQVFSSSLGTVRNAGSKDAKNSGEWGLSARWSPEWLDGTVGVYYRNFSDKLPGVFTDVQALGRPATTNSYKQYYGEDIDLLGISLSKQIAGISVGAEISHRWNMPLAGQALSAVTAGPAITPAQRANLLFRKGMPELVDNSYAARGQTWHALINAIGTISSTPLWDSASYSGELTYSRLHKVTKNPQMFNSEGSSEYICDGVTRNAATGRVPDKAYGCSTKYAVVGAVNFTPTWYQVFPSVDLSMPVSYSRGLRGNSPVTSGGNEGNGSYSIGLTANVSQKYQFDLKYVDFYGKYKETASPIPGEQMVSVVNGATTALKDRGFVNFTFKTTF